MALQFYYYPISMPSRSVKIFLKKTGIQFEEHTVDLSSAAQNKPEFLKVNPRHCVPVIIDDDFTLTEGFAILIYLADKFPDKVADHWYPKDRKKRARVNEYVSYHGGSPRQLFGKVFQDEYLFQTRPWWGMSTSKAEAEQHVKDMQHIATELQDTFLKDQKFLCGDEISIADLMAVIEVITPTISGRDTTKDHPKLAAWVERVKEWLNPEFDDVNKLFYELRKEFMNNPNATVELERKVMGPKS